MTSRQEHQAEPLALPDTVRNYVDGEWVAGAGDRVDPVVNPATGAELASVPYASAADVDAAVAAAREAVADLRAAPPGGPPPDHLLQ
jgi:hypothetical protein